MKPYKLTMKTTVVVMASDARHAFQVAKENRREIELDSELEPDIAYPVGSLADLPGKWDGECLPYGGDGETPLKNLLPPNAGINRAAKETLEKDEMPKALA
jgi:hypothetical protein